VAELHRIVKEQEAAVISVHGGPFSQYNVYIPGCVRFQNGDGIIFVRQELVAVRRRFDIEKKIQAALPVGGGSVVAVKVGDTTIVSLYIKPGSYNVEYILALLPKEGKVILTGDLNCPQGGRGLMQWVDNSAYALISDLAVETFRSGSCLDLFLTRSVVGSAEVLDQGGAEHKPIVGSFEIQAQAQSRSLQPKKRIPMLGQILGQVRALARVSSDMTVIERSRGLQAICINPRNYKLIPESQFLTKEGARGIKKLKRRRTQVREDRKAVQEIEMEMARLRQKDAQIRWENQLKGRDVWQAVRMVGGGKPLKSFPNHVPWRN